MTYNGLSGQRKEILDAIKELGKAAPNDIHRKCKVKVGSVHTQLYRLLADDFIKRIGEKEYALTDKGKAVYSKKKEDKPIQSIRFSEEEVKSYHEFAKDADFYNKISEITVPKLQGLHNEKLACVLSLISLPDKEGDRNRINVLLEGESGSGKTTLIYGITETLWGIFADSVRIRKSSLAGSAKGSIFKPGLVQVADTSLLALDEIDKLEHPDQMALLGAMSRGKLTINLDQVNRETDTRIRVISTCNRTGALLPELRSRFDLTFLLKKLSAEEEDRMIKSMVENWSRKKNILSGDFLRNYLMYCNTFESKLPADREWLAEFLIKENRYGTLQKKDNRNKETLIRLSLAIARLRLEKEVKKEHMEKAIELIGE